MESIYVYFTLTICLAMSFCLLLANQMTIYYKRYMQGDIAKVFTVSLVVTLLLMSYMGYVDTQYKNDTIPLGIVSYEFVFTVAKARMITSSWTQLQKDWVLHSFFVDHFFMLSYGFCFFLGVNWVTTDATSGAWRILISTCAIAAIFFDFMEGLFLASLVRTSYKNKELNGIKEALPYLGSVCAVVKFTLLGICLLYCLVMLCAMRREKHEKKNT